MKKEEMKARLKLAYFNYDNNMGDALNEYLIPGVFGIPVNHSGFDSCDMVGIGSIMEKAVEIRSYEKAKIWGTGFICDHEEKLDVKDRFDIYALRGRKSKELIEKNLGAEIDCVLADAGLLAPYLYDDEVEKIYDLGIVPHYVDKDDEVYQEILRKIPNSVIIDVLSGPLHAINEIRKCRHVISSSLHGLIIADSFNIPNLWVKSSEKIIGKDFKFHDYYSAFDTDKDPFDLRKSKLESLDVIRDNYTITKEAVDRKKQELLDCFPYESQKKNVTAKKKRYTVLTYNINNYELVREIEEKDPEAEYIMVTDSKDLTSSTWKVVCDENIEGTNPFDKICSIRRNVFKYCNTDICLRLDASIKIKHSLKPLIDMFEEGGYDMAVMPHPTRYHFRDEYDAWIEMRGYDPNQANKCLDYFEKAGYDLEYKGLIQSGFVICRNTEEIKKMKERVYYLVKELGEDGHMERIDQIPFSYVMNSEYRHLKILPLSEQLLNSFHMQFYLHGSDDVNGNVFFDYERPDRKYLFNEIVECAYLRTPDDMRDRREAELLERIMKIQWEKRVLEDKLMNKTKEYEEVRNSNSFKLGQKLLYIPGKIKNRNR